MCVCVVGSLYPFYTFIRVTLSAQVGDLLRKRYLMNLLHQSHRKNAILEKESFQMPLFLVRPTVQTSNMLR